jgi:tetratricopeptide (TPR) repeat protein
VRVTAQLIDGASGGHVWVERYEGELGDIFAVQDQITHNIALALQVKLTSGEMARLWEGQTGNLRAWEKMVSARDAFLRFNKIDNLTARRLLEDAISLDPAFTGAIVLHGTTFWWDARFNRAINKDHSLRLAEDSVRKAFTLNPDLGSAHMLQAAIALLRHQHDQAMKSGERAVELAPGDSNTNAFLGVVYMYADEFEKCVAAVKSAMRLSPHYPPWYTYYLVLANMWMNHLNVASELVELYLRQEPDDPFAYALYTIVLGFQQRNREAAEMTARLREKFPDFSLADFAIAQPYRNRHRLDTVLRVLQDAGLSD